MLMPISSLYYMVECYVYKNTIEGVGSDDNGTMLYMMRHKMDVKEGLHDGGIYHSQHKVVIIKLSIETPRNANVEGIQVV